jgi:prephenate dehydrogenase
MNSVSIVGVGLIGTSFGLALRKAGFKGEIAGVSSPGSIKAGIEAGAITRGVSLDEAAIASDLIYLSQPIDRMLETLRTLGPLVRPGCLVTDAGSTKVAITHTAATFLPPNSFLGGHPMAGKEQRGAIAAEADLFRDRPYVLTGAGQISNSHIAEFRIYLQKIGAQIIEMTPEEHDRTVALTSHLPQLLSTALAATLAENWEGSAPQVFGPGLIDMTRLALSAPDVWMSVLETNRGPIEDALQSFESAVREVRESLRTPAVALLFERASKFASAIRDTRKK